MGTRFLAGWEADVHPTYRDALFAGGAEGLLNRAYRSVEDSSDPS